METVEIAIIGSGPAGLSAAIYTARAGLSTLVLGCEPKVAGDYVIDNYFGFDQPITGKDLIQRGRDQAVRFGAVLRCEKVLGVHHGTDGGFEIKTEKDHVRACAVVLAPGVSRSRPAIPGLDRYEGKGVSYCVSCDGYFHRGQPVLVAGEGIHAANQALELTGYTPDVRICTLGKTPNFTGQYAEDLRRAGIPVLQTRIAALNGEQALESVTLDDGATLPAHGLFVAAGEASAADFAATLGVVQRGMFLDVDREMRTNIPGVFAAGDCTGGFLQISVAVGQGAQAAKAAIAHVKTECRGGE